MFRITLALSAVCLFACNAAKGGPTAGETDTHCTEAITPNQASCSITMLPDGGMPAEETPELRFNGDADDDDCKYHVTLTSSPTGVNTDTTLTVVVARKVDAQPATGADVHSEIFVGEHPAPNAPTKTVEATPGRYTVGPVRFDRSGQWTVKLHLYEDCNDVAEDSPHGHVSFAFDVP